MSATRPDWKSKLRRASFRGVEFGVVDAEMLFGRRNVLHEYPLRDIPFAEDLGKKAREFSFNAFCIGDNFIELRDRLIKAIEEDDTPGTLVHPTLGIKTVIPKECRVRYNNSEGGIEYLALAFVEAGENAYPTQTVNTSYRAIAIAESAIPRLEDNFASRFDTVNTTDDLIVQSANTLATLFVNKLADVGRSSGIQSNGYTSFVNKYEAFAQNAPTIMQSPPVYAEEVSDLIRSLSDFFLDEKPNKDVNFSEKNATNANSTVTVNNYLYQVIPYHPVKQAFDAQKKLQYFGDEVQLVPDINIYRIQQNINTYEFINLVKECSLAEMCRILALMKFDSRQDAIEFRDEADVYFDEELLLRADNLEDEAYNRLLEIKTAMVSDINTRAAVLKNIQNKTIVYSIPAVVFAYMQYDDATKDQEIIARNRIRNPLYIPPLSELEVLV